MLRIIVAQQELFDQDTNKFTQVDGIELEFEHSLISLSKWESEHQKPFLAGGKKTTEEVLDYVKTMILTPDYPENILDLLNAEDLSKINAYIESTQSATTFGMSPKTKGRPEIITAELIYYWMVSFNIPFECQFWHLNRLFALIRICNIKNSKQQKMSKSDRAAAMQERRMINEQRKQQLGTSG